MLMRILVVSVFLLWTSTIVVAHTPPTGKIVLSGIVRDAGSNELLTGALVKIPGTSVYTFTNEHGEFNLECASSITLQELEISLVSFSSIKIKVDNPTAPMQVALQEK